MVTQLHPQRSARAYHGVRLMAGYNVTNRCGAKTRAGHPCRRKPVQGKRRCPNHGGLSTGPITPEGKARALAALRRWRAVKCACT